MRCDPGQWAVDIHVDPHVRNCWFYHDFPGKTHHLQFLQYVYELLSRIGVGPTNWHGDTAFICI